MYFIQYDPDTHLNFSNVKKLRVVKRETQRDSYYEVVAEFLDPQYKSKKMYTGSMEKCREFANNLIRNKVNVRNNS